MHYYINWCWRTELYKQDSAQPLPSAVNVTLPAFAAERRRLLHGARCAPEAIDRYLLAAGRSAANPPVAAAAVDRWTDRRTDARPFQRPFSAYYVGSVNKHLFILWSRGAGAEAVYVNIMCVVRIAVYYRTLCFG